MSHVNIANVSIYASLIFTKWVDTELNTNNRYTVSSNIGVHWRTFKMKLLAINHPLCGQDYVATVTISTRDIWAVFWEPWERNCCQPVGLTN